MRCSFLSQEDLPCHCRLCEKTHRKGKGAHPRQGECVSQCMYQTSPEIDHSGFVIVSPGTPRALATSTSVANTTRFSTAFAWAFMRRWAQDDCGFGVSGYPTVSMSPRTAMRSRMYGTHNRAVRTVT